MLRTLRRPSVERPFGRSSGEGRGDRAENVVSGHPETEPVEATGGGSRVYNIGKYRVVAELARGGMAVVYLALARGPGTFSKLLVLKELRRLLAEDPRIVEMFMEEARLAACLSHPNVVHTLEAGSEGGRHYIAMEYLDGQPLHRVVSRGAKVGRPVPFAWRAAVLCGALEGLAYAHAAVDYQGRPLGIVHRDVSPHNVMVGYDGRVKVLDFGIAKATAASSSVDTRTGILKGKVAYMAPEQAAGDQVDVRADLFAVGVMLWEAATQRRFWAGMDSDLQILRALMDGQVGAYRDAAMAELPPAMRHVIARATDATPSNRYASATQFLSELRAALATMGVAALDAPAIGRLTLDLFAEDRAKLQRSIEDALDLYRHPTPDGDRARESGVPSLRSVAGDLTPSRAVPEVASARRRFGAGRFWVVLPVAAAAAVVAVFLATRPAAHPAPTPAGASPAAAVAPPPILDPAPAQIHLVVKVTPANARIAIDHQPALDNPVVMSLAKDGAIHSVHVEAEGWIPRDSTFRAGADETLLIGLEPRGVAARPNAVHAPGLAQAQPTAPASVAANPASSLAASSLAPSVHPPPSPVGSATAGPPQRRINAANPYGD